MVEIRNSSDVTVSGLGITGYRTTSLDAVPIGIFVTGSGNSIRLLGNHVHHLGNDNGTLGSFDINAHGIAVYGTNAQQPISDVRISGNELDHLVLGASETLVLNGNVDGRMNELVMFRAPTSRILDRDSYEFLAGRSNSGEPAWTRDIESRAPVHVFPQGRMPSEFSISWLPTVAYVPALELYVMIAGSAPGDVGIKPTDIGPGYLGMWVAECPWGPWTQFFEDEAWTPGADPGARASAPAIAPAWIAQDGSSLWFIWMDGQLMGDGPGEDVLIAGMRTTDMSVAVPGRREWGRRHPGYCVNAQRIDLIVS